MNFPEIRVIRTNATVERVVWDPKSDGADVVDLTGLKVAKVKRVVRPCDVPRVQVTFFATLSEVDEQAPA